jgi:hypothetical protein
MRKIAKPDPEGKGFSYKNIPLWDGKRGTCHRFGIGETFLTDLIKDDKVVWRQLTPGARTSKVIINQPSVEQHLQSLPVVPIADPFPPQPRGGLKRVKRLGRSSRIRKNLARLVP